MSWGRLIAPLGPAAVTTVYRTLGASYRYVVSRPERLDSLLAEAENGLGGVDLPSGSRIVVVGALMAIVLILRPSGITGGKEIRLRRVGRVEPAKEGAT